MVELIPIGFVAGIVAGISPCVLPVLPVILVTGATTPAPGQGDPAVRASLAQWWSRRSRSLAVVAGIVVSFSVLVLAGSEIISTFGLPQQFLRDLGAVALIVLGAAFLLPPLAEILERPFARLGHSRAAGSGGGFAVGLSLGLVFAPCAGPVLAAITVVGSTQRVGITAVFLTLAFAAGAGVPLLVVALAGDEVARRSAALRRHAPRLRRVAGAVLLLMAVFIAANAFMSLQTDVPGYTNALQNAVEGSPSVRNKLSVLTGNQQSTLADCDSDTTKLVRCGPAPPFTGITAWFNTPGDRPLTMAELKGKVVLIDFWTYSCINCERSLPHVEAWYRDYAKDGLVVVGVHTPEFNFEHVVSNVKAEAAKLGVKYPVAVDNGYKTWDAYDNEYWPADYLVDAQGVVRHVHFGEGDYANTESLIRRLLVAAHHPGLALPPRTDVPNKTPTGELSPETYVGYEREQFLDPSSALVAARAAKYEFPSSLPLGAFSLSGTWTDNAEEATSGSDASLEIDFLASDVYLVMGGSGTLKVSLDGRRLETIDVEGIPRLYTLFSVKKTTTGTLLLRFSPGVEAYDFTFG